MQGLELDPLSSPVSVLEAFKAFREDIDVLSLASVSEEVLADANFLFDLSEADIVGDICHLPPPADAHTPAGSALLSASYRRSGSLGAMGSPTTPTTRSPFECALDSGAPRSFSGFGAASTATALPDLEAIAASGGISSSIRRRASSGSDSVGSPSGMAPMTALAASLSLRAPPPTCAAGAARLEDLVCSTNQVSAFVSAAVRKAAAAHGGGSAAAAVAASPAVAALERAASSLADNLHSCLARYSSGCIPATSPASRIPSPQHSSSSSSPRSWESQVCAALARTCAMPVIPPAAILMAYWYVSVQLHPKILQC